MKSEENKELANLYKGPDIVEVIRSRRLRWLDHVQRRIGNTVIKRMWERRLYGMRSLARLKMHWYDQVRSNMKRLGTDLEKAEGRGVLLMGLKTMLVFDGPRSE